MCAYSNTSVLKYEGCIVCFRERSIVFGVPSNSTQNQTLTFGK